MNPNAKKKVPARFAWGVGIVMGVLLVVLGFVIFGKMDLKFHARRLGEAIIHGDSSSVIEYVRDSELAVLQLDRAHAKELLSSQILPELRAALPGYSVEVSQGNQGVIFTARAVNSQQRKVIAEGRLTNRNGKVTSPELLQMLLSAYSWTKYARPGQKEGVAEMYYVHWKTAVEDGGKFSELGLLGLPGGNGLVPWERIVSKGGDFSKRKSSAVSSEQR